MSIVIRVNPYKTASIDKAIAELKSIKKLLVEFPKAYSDALSQRLNEILLTEAPEEAKGMWTYEPKESEDGSVWVFAFDGNVEFIEFGTGIVGKENHAGINEEWGDRLPPPYTGYESGHMINPITHEWRYWDNGKWVVTTGVEANPFMYRSVQQLMTEYIDIARSVLRGGNGTGQG